MAAPRRLIVGISGATGIAYGVRLLELLRETDVETHLVVSRAADITRAHEIDLSAKQLRALANVSYPVADIGAAVASGSFRTMGMIVAPCSVRTLAEIATGTTTNLLTRAADVVLKERRRLVLAVRESPLSEIHLENMLKLSRMGVVISPPLPAFYTRPASIDEMVDHSVSRLLDQLGVHLDVTRWTGDMDPSRRTAEAANAEAGVKRLAPSAPAD